MTIWCFDECTNPENLAATTGQGIFLKITIRLNRIFTGEAGLAEIILTQPGRFDQPLNAEIGQGIQAQVLGNFGNTVFGGNKFLVGRKIDALITGMAGGGTADHHVIDGDYR